MAADAQPRGAGSTQQPAVSKPAQPQKMDVDDAAALNLFSACLKRDGWLEAIAEGGAEPWQAERSRAHKRTHRLGDAAGSEIELLKVERSGSRVVASVVSSTLADVGEVLWTVDARDRTLTSFGQPGWGGKLLGDDCVLLVDESAGGRIVLYLYAGEVCQLRCWRRHASSEQGDGAAEQPPPRSHTKPRTSSKRRHSKHPKDAAPQSHPHRSEAKADLPRADKVDEAARVAAWAKGKDLAALLGGLRDKFGHALQALREQSCEDAASMRAQPSLLRKAYRRAMLACHPDKHADSPPRSQALAVALFHVLSAARASDDAAMRMNE